MAIDGYDPVYGARPLRRLIQREVTDRVATEIIDGHISDGAKVTIDLDSDGNYCATVENRSRLQGSEGSALEGGEYEDPATESSDADDVVKQANDVLRGMNFGDQN